MTQEQQLRTFDRADRLVRLIELQAPISILARELRLLSRAFTEIEGFNEVLAEVVAKEGRGNLEFEG